MSISKQTPQSLGVHEVHFGGGILQRGFWLYIWKITPPNGEPLHYIGRTGDSSSTKAQSPFNRMGQHLGFAKTSCMLRTHLGHHGVKPEECTFHLVSVGPIEAESREEGRVEHDHRRDRVAAMERALAEGLKAAGYRVMNEVNSRKPLDAARFAEVRAAFAAAFPSLSDRA